MKELDKLLDEYIGGGRGAWYFHIELGDRVFEAGQFYYKSDALRALRSDVLDQFGHHSIALEFLRMRHR